MILAKWQDRIAYAVCLCALMFQPILYAADLFSDTAESDPVRIRSVTPDADSQKMLDLLARFGKLAADPELIADGKGGKEQEDALFDLLQHDPAALEPLMILLRMQHANKELAPDIAKKLSVFAKNHPQLLIPGSIVGENLMVEKKYEEAAAFFKKVVRAGSEQERLSAIERNENELDTTSYLSSLSKLEICALEMQDDALLRKIDAIHSKFTEPLFLLTLNNERLIQLISLLVQNEKQTELLASPLLYSATRQMEILARIDRSAPLYAKSLAAVLSSGKPFEERKHLYSLEFLADGFYQDLLLTELLSAAAELEKSGKDQQKLLWTLGVVYANTGKHALSAAMLERLLRTPNVKNPVLLHLDCARQYRLAGMLDKSAGEFETAASMMPPRFRSQSLLEAARIRIGLQEPAKALALLDQFPPFDFQAAYLRVIAHHFAKNKKEALRTAKLFLILLEQNKIPLHKNKNLLLSVLDIMTRCGEYEIPEAFLRSMLKEEPDDPVMLNFLGFLLADRNKDLQEAKTLIEKALKKEPDSPAYIDSMAWVLYRMNDHKNAVVYMERALAEQNRQTKGTVNAELCDHAGDIYFALGDRQKALRFWHMALEHNEDEELDPEQIRNKIKKLEDKTK